MNVVITNAISDRWQQSAIIVKLTNILSKKVHFSASVRTSGSSSSLTDSSLVTVNTTLLGHLCVAKLLIRHKHICHVHGHAAYIT